MGFVVLGDSDHNLISKNIFTNKNVRNLIVLFESEVLGLAVFESFRQLNKHLLELTGIGQ